VDKFSLARNLVYVNKFPGLKKERLSHPP